jgi:hypothetical protein
MKDEDTKRMGSLGFQSTFSHVMLCLHDFLRVAAMVSAPFAFARFLVRPVVGFRVGPVTLLVRSLSTRLINRSASVIRWVAI